MYPTARVLKALALTSLCAAFVACGSKSNDNKNQPVTPQEITEAAGGLSASGQQVSVWKAGPIEAKVLVSGGPATLSVDEVFASYPSISSRYAFLGTINKAVKTDANTLDLYSNDVLVLTLAHDTATDMWSIANSSNGLTVDKIAYMESFADQTGSHPDSLHFVLSECKTVEQQAPAQAPTQEEAKPEEKPVGQQQAQAQQAPEMQSKLPEAQAQAKLMGAPEAKPEEQAKPEAKPEEKPTEEVKPEQTCASVETLIWLEEQKVEVQQQAQQEEKPEAQQAPTQAPAQAPEAQQVPAPAQAPAEVAAPAPAQGDVAAPADTPEPTIAETPTVAQRRHFRHYNGRAYDNGTVIHEKPGYETPYTMFPNSGLPPF